MALKALRTKEGNDMKGKKAPEK